MRSYLHEIRHAAHILTIEYGIFITVYGRVSPKTSCNQSDQYSVEEESPTTTHFACTHGAEEYYSMVGYGRKEGQENDQIS
jgi:hypothetical protein